MSLGSALSGLNRLNNFGAGRRSSTPTAPTAIFGSRLLVNALPSPSNRFTDAAGTIPCADGDLIYTANDTNGSAGTVQFQQATSGARPTLKLVGGKWADRFSGAQILPTVSTIGIPSNVAIAAVFSCSGNGLFCEQGPDSNTNPGFYLHSTIVNTFTNNGASGLVSKNYTSNWASDSVKKTAIVTCDGTSAGTKMYVNGTQVSLTTVNAGNPGTGTVTDTLYRGARSGSIAAITADFFYFGVAYNVSDSEAAQWSNYLATL